MGIEHPFDDKNKGLPAFGQVRWNCRRGMKELEVLLIPFVDTAYEQLTDEQKLGFIRMLEYDDASLYSWFLGYEPPPTAAIADVLAEVQVAIKHLLSNPSPEERFE